MGEILSPLDLALHRTFSHMESDYKSIVESPQGTGRWPLEPFFAVFISRVLSFKQSNLYLAWFFFLPKRFINFWGLMGINVEGKTSPGE